MTQSEITQAFEGRWRIKAEKKPVAYVKGVRDLCRDFFEAGILLSEKPTTPEETTTPAASAAGKAAAVPPASAAGSLFETWWSLYDKKCGKEKCLQKWLKLKRSEQEACIAATPAYVASTPDKQYRKHPLTYLNQKSWNDEIIHHHNAADSHQQDLAKLASILAD